MLEARAHQIFFYLWSTLSKMNWLYDFGKFLKHYGSHFYNGENITDVSSGDEDLIWWRKKFYIVDPGTQKALKLL